MLVDLTKCFETVTLTTIRCEAPATEAGLGEPCDVQRQEDNSCVRQLQQGDAHSARNRRWVCFAREDGCQHYSSAHPSPDSCVH